MGDPRDVTITCVVCGEPFAWATGEQRFYEAHKLSTPKRCKACRGAPRTDRTCRSCKRPFSLADPTTLPPGPAWNLCDECRPAVLRLGEGSDDRGTIAATCSACGRSWASRGAERAWFALRGRPLPTRCRGCRKAARLAGAAPRR